MSQSNGIAIQKLEYDSPPYDGLDIDFIVSIDFGSYGFASSYCLSGIPSHQRIIKDWSTESCAATELNKNLAALLIDKDTQQTIAIGYEAEKLYAEAIKKNQDDKLMYFQHFKPYLYSKDHINKNMQIFAADGKSSLYLSDLIKKSFEAVMQHCINYINQFQKMEAQRKATKKNVFWVISVPAIWDEMSKEMMKLCALEAGMKYFELGSEPLVSAWHVISDVDWQRNKKERNRFIVLDCGGATIDASCIEILDDDQVKELHFSDGIRCGGLDIDKKFMNVLEYLLPNEVINKIKKEKPGQWVRQRHEFGMAKFTVPLDLEGTWNVDLCFGISQWLSKKWKKRRKDKTFNELKQKVQSFGDDDDEKGGLFDIGKCNLKVTKKGWLYLHEEVLGKIVDFVDKLFNTPGLTNCDNIIVSGGFANSKYLISRLQNEFPTKKFHSPKQPHLSVAKGALWWICEGKRLKKTRPKYSYGIAIDKLWNKEIHSIKRRKEDVNHNGYIVENAFGLIVEKNKEYEHGYKETFKYYIPSNTNNVEIILYASQDKFCQYVFEEDGVTLPTKEGRKCFKVKKFILKLDKKMKQKTEFDIVLEYKQCGINLYFIDPNDGKTEVKVQVDTTTISH